MRRAALAPILASALAGATAAAEPPAIVAVFDLELSGVALPPKKLETLDAYLHRKLASGTRLSVVPRAEVRKRLRREKAESYSECYDQSCQIEIGKELAAQMTVSAKVLRIGDECLVSLLLYDLRTAASAGAAEASGGCTLSGLVRSVETAALALARPAPASAPTKRLGVVDPKRCPRPDTRRVGDPPPKGRHFYCVDAENQRHGPSVAFHANGQVAMRETYVDGLGQGTQARFHPNGKPAERGEIVDGKRTGIWTRWSSRGDKTEEGPYVDGVKSGDWKQFDRRRGYVREVVRYERDLRHGPTEGRREDGSVRFRGQHVQGERSGTWTRFDEDGGVERTTEYRAGQRHGEMIRFDDEGEPKSLDTYRDDVREGPSKSWRRRDGVRYLAYVTRYAGGEEHGVRMSFRADGTTSYETSYRRGDKHGPYAAFRTTKDGRAYRSKHGAYADGKKSGLWRTYAAPDRLKSEITYVAGRKSGPYTRYNARTGHKRESGTYRKGRRHGWVVRYDADGEPRSRRRYVKGRGQRTESLSSPKTPKKKVGVATLGALGGDGVRAVGVFGAEGVPVGLLDSADTVTVTVTKAQGGQSGAALSRQLATGRPRMRKCFGKAKRPAAVTLELRVEADGRVAKVARRKGVERTVACLRKLLRKQKFGAASSPTEALVQLDFRPGR